VRWDEEKQNRRLKLCYPPWGRPLKRKALLKDLDINLQQDSQTPGGKKKNKCYQCGELGHFK
jgi:hypothetical protein